VWKDVVRTTFGCSGVKGFRKFRHIRMMILRPRAWKRFDKDKRFDKADLPQAIPLWNMEPDRWEV
jgi:hypothetical protein